MLPATLRRSFIRSNQEAAISDDADIQGQINALRDAINALQLLPQEQRNQFHMNMQRLNPPTQSPGYMAVRGNIVRHIR